MIDTLKKQKKHYLICAILLRPYGLPSEETCCGD